MEIIAKTTGGVLISATDQEVKEILNAVTGTVPKELSVGDKIPAIDYAQTIKNVKTLGENSQFKNLVNYAEVFVKTIKSLEEKVISASNIKG